MSSQWRFVFVLRCREICSKLNTQYILKAKRSTVVKSRVDQQNRRPNSLKITYFIPPVEV